MQYMKAIPLARTKEVRGDGTKLFPLNYLPYLFEKNAVVVEFI